MTHEDDQPASRGEPRKLFYGKVVGEADLREALEVQDLDEEVAILRMRLREHLDKHGEDTVLLQKSVESLAKAAAIRYRIGGKRTNDLASALAATVNALTEQMVP
jgi:hypothetical protein